MFAKQLSAQIPSAAFYRSPALAAASVERPESRWKN